MPKITKKRITLVVDKGADPSIRTVFDNLTKVWSEKNIIEITLIAHPPFPQGKEEDIRLAVILEEGKVPYHIMDNKKNHE